MNTTMEQLWDFIRHHGVRLDAYGSFEPGLRHGAALELLSLIEASGIDLHGMEVWRRDGDVYFPGDAPACVWYPERLSRREDFEDAIKFLAQSRLAPDDVVLIQYKGSGQVALKFMAAHGVS